MEITYRSIDNLIPYKRNAKLHPDSQVAKNARSIQEFGFRNPVLVDGQGEIIAGHGRMLAAKTLGMEQIPTIDASDMTPEQVRAYRIADNKLVESGWDQGLLKVEVGGLQDAGFDVELLGFANSEIENLLQDPNFEPGAEGDQGKLDQLEPKWIACPHCGKEFDLCEQEG